MDFADFFLNVACLEAGAKQRMKDMKKARRGRR